MLPLPVPESPGADAACFFGDGCMLPLPVPESPVVGKDGGIGGTLLGSLDFSFRISPFSSEILTCCVAVVASRDETFLAMVLTMFCRIKRLLDKF